PAGHLQHDSNSAARRRQRAQWPLAGEIRRVIQLRAAVRVSAALCAHSLGRIRLLRRAAVPAHPFLASDEVTAAKPRVVSGMRPTGPLHIGHLVGALNNWIGMQERYDSFHFVADWHALTS